jgi:hypothetical protein
MQKEDFQKLAQLMHDVIIKHRPVKEEVASFRQRFLDMHFCFSDSKIEEYIQQLHKLI